MLTEVKGDLFAGGYKAIGHGVNCHKVMGAGIAYSFAKRWPKMYEEYKDLTMKPGEVFYYATGNGWVHNIATQDEPGRTAKYAYVVVGVHQALKLCRALGTPHLALPAIGCGIGGLTYETVVKRLSEVAEMVPEVDLIMVTQ